MILKRVISFVTIVALTPLCALSVLAAQPSRVAIIPFKIHADRDISFLRDGIVDMLTTRLSWEDKVVVIEREVTEAALTNLAGPMNEKAARHFGSLLHADYVLFGSLTIFGESVSIDAKMIDVHGVKPPVTIFTQSHGMDTVIPKINLFAADINKKIFGRVLRVARQEPQPYSQQPASPGIYAHPEKLLGELGAGTSDTSDLNPDFIMAYGGRKTTGFWKSRNFPLYIKAMALGDVDGDGKQEVVFVTSNRIFVYRNVNRRFVNLKEIAGKSTYNFLSVDVADINANGKAEIFITNVDTRRNSLDSFVLEWENGNLIPITKNDAWYYRVLELPMRGVILLGQRRGISEAFLPGIYKLAWQNGKYESVETLQVPDGINIYAFTLADVMNNGGELLVAFTQDDYLEILTKSGSKEWKSDEHYGGSLKYLDTKSEPGDSEKERIFLPQRIFVKDLDRDGKNEVIVIKNHAAASRLFKRFRQYTSSEIVSLSWDGLGLALNWKTRKIHGYVSDMAIGDFDNDGQQELIASVVMSKGASFFQKGKSAIIGYDLRTSKQ